MGLDAFVAALRQADPLVVRLGLAAIAIGLVGPLLTNPWLGLRSDHQLFQALTSTGTLPPQQSSGPFSSEFRSFIRQGAGQLPLSPDSIVQALDVSLSRKRDTLESRTRLFSYLPLLVGLVATALALRGVLSSVATNVGADKLLKVGPEVFSHTASALMGTVMGVSGAFCGTVWQVVFGVFVSRVHAEATEYLYSVVAPTLPAARVKLQFEDQVLEVIQARTAAIVDEFSKGLTPVVKTLLETALNCSEAASQAGGAFSEVAKAVKDAKGLTRAAALLEASTRQSSEAATLLACQSGELNKVAVALHPSAVALVEGTSKLSGAANALQECADALRLALKDAPDSLDASVKQVADKAAVIAQSTVSVAGRTASLATEVAALREVVGNFGDAKVDEISSRLVNAVQEMKKLLSDAFVRLPAEVSRELSLSKTTALDVSAAIQGLQESLAACDRELSAVLDKLKAAAATRVTSPSGLGVDPGMMTAVGQLAGEMRAVATRTDDMLRELNRISIILNARLTRRFNLRKRFPFLSRHDAA